MSNATLLRGGQQLEVDSVDGPDNSGDDTGFEIKTNLGRVDQATVQSDDSDYYAASEVSDDASDNTITVTVFEQDGDAEVTDDTDLSDSTFTYTAIRQ